MAQIQDGVGSNLLKINTDLQAEIKPANPIEVDGTLQPNKVGSTRMQGEVDAGNITGVATLTPPYVDQYYRQYITDANGLDSEEFTYTAQNTGKHSLLNTTMTAGFTAAGLTTNSGSITTTNVGLTFGTYAMFSLMGNTNLDCEFYYSFSNQPTANRLEDVGFFQRGAANAYTPLDGAYFRLDSAGVKPVLNSNGTEVEGTVVNFTKIDGAVSYTNNKVYRFYISVTTKATEFWINDVLVQKMVTNTALSQPFLSQAIPFSIRTAHVGGAAGAVIQGILKSYSVIIAGVEYSDSLGTVNNRIVGSYQGLGGGTMGSLANYANNANPTAAVPTNTTAALGTGLGGQFWETDTLAVTTDGIIMSYQVPAGSATVQGKRLKLVSIKIDSFIQTALTGGGYNAQFALAFGHTNVSLVTAESASAKAPRRIALGSYTVASAAAALVQNPTILVDFSGAEVFINPGEFIQVVKKKIGTAPSAGVIAYTITPTYTWE